MAATTAYAWAAGMFLAAARLRERRAASPEREVAARAGASGDVRGAPASPTAPR